MCPTFIATHDEVMSTRGRANIIRAALELRANGHDPLKSDELDAALSNCLSCKGCTPECPSNVNLALLKAEMIHARWRRDGLPLRERILSNVDLLGKLGCLMPRLTNRLLDFKPVRVAMEKTLGISGRRSLPHYASERFDKWFAKHMVAVGAPRRPDPHAERHPYQRPRHPLGRHLCALSRTAHRDRCGESSRSARIRSCARKKPPLLRTPGIQPGKSRCRGKTRQTQHRSSFIIQYSLGRRSFGEGGTAPILFLEPSCWSMFVEDYRELKIENAEKIAARCFLFEKFVDDLLAQEPEALRFKHESRSREIRHPSALPRQIDSESGVHGASWPNVCPDRKATVLDTGCCGMAGAFGALAEKYDLSRPSRATLARQIDNQPRGTEVIASGTSCRHQITDLTNLRPKHMAELLAEAL